MRLDPGAGDPEAVSVGSIDGHDLILPNAIAFDEAGQLYLTESFSASEPGPGIYRIDPDGTGHLWSAGPFLFANGIAVSPDQRGVYVAETWSRRVTLVPFLDDGSAGEPELVAELPGTLPDGLGVRHRTACCTSRATSRTRSSASTADGTSSVVIRDDNSMLLDHPTNIAFRGSTAFCANLGRWHITAIELDA